MVGLLTLLKMSYFQRLDDDMFRVMMVCVCATFIVISQFKLLKQQDLFLCFVTFHLKISAFLICW